MEGGAQAEEVDAVLGRLTVREYFVHVDSLSVTRPSVPWARGWTQTDLALLRRFPICEGESNRQAHQDHHLRTPGARGSPGEHDLVPLTS